MMRVREGIGGWWVDRGVGSPASDKMHASRMLAEREMAEMRDAEMERAWDWVRSLDYRTPKEAAREALADHDERRKGAK